MSKEIVFDIETQNTFADIGSKNDMSKLLVSLVGVYSYETDKYLTFMEDELNEMWPLFENASRLITYNGKHFDLPVLNNYYSGDLLTFNNLDIYEEVEKSSGKRLKLDHIAKGTLNIGKIGSGLDAIEYWKKGDIDNLKKYCLKDVEITKKVYEYGLKYSNIFYKNDFGEHGKIDIDFQEKAKNKSKINLTLPF
ncbi:MAG: ribonuclease H-like domain-containing protein [bacterium]